jgi:hypothetical protein
MNIRISREKPKDNSLIMKNIQRITLIGLIILFYTCNGIGQLCPDFQKLGDCQKDFEPTMRYYNQSRSDVLEVGSSMQYNIVFYGNKEYKLSFCTYKKFYPVHFKMIDVLSQEVLYDNESDGYIESIGFGIEKTKQILVEVEILARRANKKDMEETIPCLGMLLQFKVLE